MYVVTHSVTVDTLLRGQLSFMREQGFDVSVVSSPGPELRRVREREGVTTYAVPIARAIHPVEDLRSVWALRGVLARVRPHILNASTPKAGLLGMLAAQTAGTPARIYMLRGLRLETATGKLRQVLALTERVATTCAHEVVCVSPSLARAAIEGGYAPAAKTRVVADGTSNGVDVARFVKTPKRIQEGRARLEEVGVDAGEDVIGFVGRFDKDKGLAFLLDAFAKLRETHPRARLVLIGAGFADDTDPVFERRVREARHVVVLPKTDDLAPLYAAMKVLAFPSYREGFPNVPLEAACAEVPTVGFASTGVVDAVEDGATGVLVPKDDVAGFVSALARYLDGDELRSAHGRAAKVRAMQFFSRERVWQAWADHYRELWVKIAS